MNFAVKKFNESWLGHNRSRKVAAGTALIERSSGIFRDTESVELSNLPAFAI